MTPEDKVFHGLALIIEALPEIDDIETLRHQYRERINEGEHHLFETKIADVLFEGAIGTTWNALQFVKTFQEPGETEYE